MKKPLLVFAATIGVSFVLRLAAILRSYLSSLAVSVLTYPGLTYPYWALVSIALVNFLSALLVFASFYFLGKKGKIKAERPIVIGLILGLLVGSIFNQLSYNGQDNSFFVTSDVFNYLNYLSANIFFLFFPAIAALLFVELRERKQAEA